LVHGLSVSDHNLGRFLSRGFTPSPYNPDPFLTHCKLWCNVTRIWLVSIVPKLPRSETLFPARGPLTLTLQSPPFVHVTPTCPTQVRLHWEGDHIALSGPMLVRIRTYIEKISHISTASYPDPEPTFRNVMYLEH
jgi:hypothetical protein